LNSYFVSLVVKLGIVNLASALAEFSIVAALIRLEVFWIRISSTLWAGVCSAFGESMLVPMAEYLIFGLFEVFAIRFL
jgi:hypothetical protein